MKKYIVFALFIAFTNFLEAQDLATYFTKSDAFFKTYVLNGRVAYDKLHKDPKRLDEVLQLAEGIKLSVDDAANYQAFWINAYNLAVIKGVLNHYPLNSPLDQAGFFDIITYKLGGKTLTLNDIEHKLLRAKFKDPRFHFVLVCGAIGCPPLISKAYLPSTLNSQLETQTNIALNGTFLQVNVNKKRVLGPEILKWYKEDFTMNGTTEIDYINKYRKNKIPSNYKLGYFTYNWKLNKQ